MISVLFDLDGTLVDTSEGIIKGIEEVEKRMDFDILPYDVKKSFIGPPLFDSFKSHYQIGDDIAGESVRLFREYYSRQGKYECSLYFGMTETLELIKEHNIRLFVATSKPTEFAYDIINYLGLRDCFLEIIGSNLDNTRSKKEQIIRFILNKYQCVNDKTVMVGDKKQDIYGAKVNNIHSIGVSYGFGSFDEISCSSPDAIADNVENIIDCMKKINCW